MISNTATAALMMPIMLQIVDTSQTLSNGKREMNGLLFVADTSSVAGMLTPGGSWLRFRSLLCTLRINPYCLGMRLCALIGA
jgi:hypothetical protein